MAGTKFKETEIGLIPEGWSSYRIDELFDIGNGYTPSKSNPSYWTNGTIPWFRLEDIRQNGRVLNDSIQHITPLAVKSGKLFPAGSFILSTTATIGEHALLTTDSLANQRFSFLVKKRNCDNLINTKFFLYYMYMIGDWCRSNVNAGGLLAVNMEDLKNYTCTVPPLKEQERIAVALSSVDELIASLDKQIAKTRDIKQGVIQRLPKGPKCLPLGDISEVKRGVRVVRSQLGNGEYPVYQNSLVPLGYYDKFNCLAGTPFVIAAGAAGEIGYSKTNFWAADDCYYFVCSEGLSNAYLYYFLLSQQSFIGSQVRKASIPRLNHSIISNLLVPMLPIDEQKHIASVLTSFDDTIEGLEAKRQKYESIKAGMMQQLLTGTTTCNVNP